MPVSSTMFCHLNLRAPPMVRFIRLSLLWVIVTGALFVACMTLRHMFVGIKDYASGADYWRTYWTGSSVRNYSHQQLSHLLAFSNTYVISLPRRADRRAQMDLLKDTLHVGWTYVDAIEANSSAVTTILRQVYILRSQLEPQLEHGNERAQEDAVFPVFDWPRDIEAVIHSQGALRPFGADLWTLPSSSGSTDLQTHTSVVDPLTFAHMPSKPVATVDPPPLACASGNNVSATFSSNLPFHRHLSAAKVACWYSHFQIIHDVANGKHEAALVLEDDVDIEHDMDRRLQALWGALPRDWDIIYLGHCWSDESQFPPLRNISLRLPSGHIASSALHPASAPKCTHAYMLSRTGARRIVVHLRHPPFAYSRAIDQALSWLVQSRRLRAFSIVPPVVVQRKISGSDVMPGLGSAWRSKLYDGVMEVIEQTKEPMLSRQET